ncbi:MAG: tRNA guanosine(34) transglycosylase Tgt [Chloroflexota bacterium]
MLNLNHGRLELPVFLPDATLGVVRGVDGLDLKQVGLQALMMNVFHLMQKPGSSTIQALGGLHRMACWDGPIFTDSGGFQAYSLIRQNKKFGKLSDRGISFQPEGAGRKFQLTPEKSIQRQLAYGADVVYCLDDCTHVDDALEEQEKSVKRTIEWAKRCRDEFERQGQQKQWDTEKRPRLFAIVQGGGETELREQCATALLEMGFDGYGYGGWPLDSENQLLADMLSYTRSLIPKQYAMHALGVGHPQHIVTCFQLGYQIYDSAMPTRDARHARLFCFAQNPQDPAFSLAGDWFRYLYLQDRKHVKTNQPISDWCDCHTCNHYTIGYLHHLFKSKDTLFYRLATIHNLFFMMQLMTVLKRMTGSAKG